ncbi:MAG: trigger factor [Parcubacteria group bacterium GW2011_GWA2_38_13b]|nr:MAG: trigger factor [Parcubacteria group bacterium GW2011_GWA2_38_13b]
MNVIKKDLPKSMMEITVTVAGNEMNGYFEQAAANLSQNIKIGGFRSGKAPIDTVEKKVGSQELFNEAAGIAVRRTLPKVLMEHKIDSLGIPDIKILKIAKGNDFEYKAEIAVLPKVLLPDYKKIVSGVKKQKTEISDKEINDALMFLRKSRASFIGVDRGVVKGDRANIDFSAVDENGARIKNGEQKNQPLIIGDSLFIGDFEENLIGLKSGDCKEFQVKFPENYYDKEISGKTVNFKVKVNLVEEIILPEEKDDFAKDLGKFDGLESLKKSIAEGLIAEKESREQERWAREALREIAEKSEMDVPEILINSELERIVNNLKANVAQAGLRFEDYLGHIKKTVDDLKRDNRNEAENSVRANLVLKNIGDKENIEVPDKEVGERLSTELLRHYKSVDEARKKIDLPRLKDYYYGIIRNEKTISVLKKFID